MRESIPPSWRPVLERAIDDPSFAVLESFVARERVEVEVYPPPDLVFEALRLTPFDAVRAVILGQDPYHQPGLAHGLAFSVPDGARQPGSLKSILGELASDLGRPVPRGRSLEPWTRHGVLLLNSVLTVRRGVPRSHSGHGWEAFTDEIVRAVAATPGPVAFVFWGQDAQAKASLVDGVRHPILMAAHPSPLSVWRGFRGSRPFSRVNAELAMRGAPPIDWSLDAAP